jgi:2-amino-4-hydroxy-6-hydroxymethyldihydropteridine diphosphokinase
MVEVFVSIGSNIDRAANVASAVGMLNDTFGALRVSSVFESAAVGFDGDPFFNLVVGFSTVRSVQEVAEQLADIEERHGRERDSKKFSARTLDLDLLLYGDEVIRLDRLNLPRDEIARYAFVLQPLAELAPDRSHPVLGQTYRELWQAYDKTGLAQRRVDFPVDAWRDTVTAQGGGEAGTAP